jgi:hypothetical protein
MSTLIRWVGNGAAFIVGFFIAPIIADEQIREADRRRRRACRPLRRAK